jgi:antitoxin (DNA-binding transcriptional repressor) of toxin-antitoxin stability system
METIKIAALKARLSEVLRRVRKGEAFTIMDRDTPIASLTLYKNIALKAVAKASKRIEAPQPTVISHAIDSLKLLREDRNKR